MRRDTACALGVIIVTALLVAMFAGYKRGWDACEDRIEQAVTSRPAEVER